MELAACDRAPTTALGHEAVATRAAFEARTDESLEYFSPVSQTPGFPKALARTLLDLRLAAVASGDLARLPRRGTDLAALLERVEILLAEAGASDRASLFETATKALGSPVTGWPPMPLLLLDVPLESEIEAAVSLGARSTVAAGDDYRASRRRRHGQPAREARRATPDHRRCRSRTILTQLARYLFSKEPPPERKRTGELVWFSAPGEGRECVEIARRILQEADRGVRFDEMAIVIRSAQQYVGLLEHALSRAGVAAYFERGTRRPDPAGRAFLAILSCATENFSAKRFAEYLSLAQVPSLEDSGKASVGADHSIWVASRDDVFGVLSERAPDDSDDTSDDDQGSAANATDDQAVVAGTLRAPWKWETLLVESAVIGGSDRWARRLNGLAARVGAKNPRAEIRGARFAADPRLERERQNLAHLRTFALPLIEAMSAWPKTSPWGDWLQRLEGWRRACSGAPSSCCACLPISVRWLRWDP